MTMNNRLLQIGIPTLHCYNRLAALLTALDNDQSFSFDLSFTIIDNGGQLKASRWMEAIDQLNSKVVILVPSRNLGVSASFNLITRRLGQCFIASDDIAVTKADLSLMVDASASCPESIFICHQEGGFTVFWVNRPDAWLAMGGFDENFYPAYYEDNDATRRLELAGLHRTQVTLPGWSHANSSTLYDGSPEYQSAHWALFNQNGFYYQQKWGGMPGSETFASPFNK
jgi:GT2 family glycosyltransferase